MQRFVAVVAVASLAFSSCSDDPDPQAPDVTAVPTPEVIGEVAAESVLPETSSTTTTTTTAPTTTTTTLPPPDPLSPDLQRQVDELIAVTEALRGRRFIEDPVIEVLTPDEVVEKRRVGLEEDLDPEELVSEAALYELFGLIEPGTDLFELYTDFYSAGTLAYYDLEDRRLIVPLIGDELNEYEKWILVHELTHALMDQHYPAVADAYENSVEDGNFDHAGALAGLLEGEAVLVQTLYLEGVSADQRAEVVSLSQQRSNPSFGRAPEFLQDLLRFSYTSGSLLALDLYGRGGMEALDQAFEVPPFSTEQVIHPDRYVALEVPVEFEALTATIDGFEVVEEGSWGERGWRILLGSHLNDGLAFEAADGWGGDHYEILWNSASGEVAFVVTYRADSPEDGAEMVDAVERFVDTGMDVAGPLVTETSSTWSGSDFAYLSFDEGGFVFVAASNSALGAEIVGQIAG